MNIYLCSYNAYDETKAGIVVLGQTNYGTEAEALEEMAPSDTLADMEAEYGAAGDGAVDDEVAKMMAAANKS